MFEDNGNCIYGKFHGCSGSMECYNAAVLFKRSASFGFMYSEYVSDGDSKVLKHLQSLNIYPGHKLGKFECGNHMSKRACNAFHKCGQRWQPNSKPIATSVKAKINNKKVQDALKTAAADCQ